MSGIFGLVSRILQVVFAVGLGYWGVGWEARNQERFLPGTTAKIPLGRDSTRKVDMVAKQKERNVRSSALWRDVAEEVADTVV